MKNISQIFIILFIITIKFKPRLCHEVTDLQNNEQIKESIEDNRIELKLNLKPEETTAANATLSEETVTLNENLNYTQIEMPSLKENSALNRSIEYLIDEPNTSNTSHNQEVIIKPLNEVSVNVAHKLTDLNSENEQKFNENLAGLANQSTVSIVDKLDEQILNIEPTTFKNPLIESQNQNEVILPVYEKKEELIINLLNPSHDKVTTSILKESTIPFKNNSDNMQEKFENQITTVAAVETYQDHLSNETTLSSIKFPINHLNQILKHLIKGRVLPSNNQEQELSATANQSMEMLNKDSSIPEPEKKEDFLIKTVELQNIQELLTTLVNFKSNFTEAQKNNNTSNTNEPPPTVSLLQTLISPSLSTKSEEEESTAKPLTTLEDYAVKQMNFILDHMLLESQAFVSKVLQATSNTIFQRDHLKRYVENINRLLNPQLENEYSDDISDSKPVMPDDLYEQVIIKLNFFKSPATKRLQQHLPADWVKDYKDIKDELKIWLDKVSNEMHREFNLYLNEEADHIKYLYFNEAFDDIIRATEIHQKLALMADLIKIVKNKKQITFMDLYMQ